jgi:hypothetical protein
MFYNKMLPQRQWSQARQVSTDSREIVSLSLYVKHLGRLLSHSIVMVKNLKVQAFSYHMAYQNLL